MKRWQTPLTDEIRDTPAPPRPPQWSEKDMSEQNNGIEYSITVNHHNLDDVEARLDRIIVKLERAIELQKQLEDMESNESCLTPQEMAAKFTDSVTHPDSTMTTAEELYGFLYVRRGMSFTGRDIPIRDIKDWERARGMLIVEYSDRTEYLPTLRDWLDNTVYPRIKVVNT